MAPTESDHAALFAKAAPAVRERLEAIQRVVETEVPGAERHVGYGMPAFRKGRVFFYFGAFRRHIGVYPPVTAPAELVEELAPFRGPKGNLAFPLKDPLPLDLIGRVARALAAQYGS
jgi:uncharacterized protein YdhG (YjbR/CyaY superfamily)